MTSWKERLLLLACMGACGVLAWIVLLGQDIAYPEIGIPVGLLVGYGFFGEIKEFFD